VGHIRPFLKWLLESDPLPPAWAAALKQRWGYEIPKVAIVKPEELDALVEACPDWRDKARIRLLADTGFRNSGACALNELERPSPNEN
jgi:integrase